MGLAKQCVRKSARMLPWLDPEFAKKLETEMQKISDQFFYFLPWLREKRQTIVRRRTDLIMVNRVRVRSGREVSLRGHLYCSQRVIRHFDCVQFNVNDILVWSLPRRGFKKARLKTLKAWSLSSPNLQISIQTSIKKHIFCWCGNQTYPTSSREEWR